MGFDDIKTNLEKAAGPVDDKAKEMFDKAKDKVGDMAGNDTEDQTHAKGGAVEGTADQYRRDQDMDDADINRANPLDTGVDEDEFGAPGTKTPASNLDPDPMMDDDEAYEE
jgi:hypothetical protein